MRSTFLIIAACLCGAGVFAQDSKQKIDSLMPRLAKDSIVHINGISANNVQAQFPGGTPAWTAYINKNLNFEIPVSRGAAPGTYEVVVNFMVDTAGNIQNVKEETSFGFGMEKELIRVVKKGPKWMPATQNGVHVNAYRRQPVTFFISN